jgi:serine/threonine protein kinase
LPQTPEPGRLVGSSYVLICPVGRGATGTVWRGLESTTGDPVAVKLMHEGLLRQPAMVTRFVQERTILKRVRHEHVVGVRDLFSVGESLGLAMEYADGGSLREKLRRDGPFPPAEAARLLAQAAAALRVAHELGVVHRDIKPDNILLSAHGDVRLSDFGIARVLDEPGVTNGHTVVGTPHYMAPEAISGGEAHPAADVYALGVVLFELITGRAPFAGEPFAVLQSHLDQRPRRPVGVSDDAWAVIAHCLEKDPRRRPDAQALHHALLRLVSRLAGVPAMRVPAPPAPRVTAPPLSQRKSRRPVNRPRDWAWGRKPLALLILVALSATALPAAVQPMRADRVQQAG